jgi:hypothetical protein
MSHKVYFYRKDVIATNEELIELVNRLEVLNDSIIGVMEYYAKLEQHFKEPIDSNKLKILINNSNKRLLELIDEFYKVINNH